MVKKDKIKVWIVTAVFLLAAVLSMFLIGKVEINYSLSDYLDESKGTKTALNIINDEFGMTTDIKVMVRDVDKKEAAEISAKLSDVSQVLNVSFDANSEKNYKQNTALFTVFVKGDEYSKAASRVYSDVKTLMDGEYAGRVSYGGTVASTAALRNTITGEMGYILVIAVLLVVAILLLTAKSYLEPLVLLFASGIAIVINLGTNIIFGNISYITSSVAAILQLALSIDYSIALLHSYRDNKSRTTQSYEAMCHTVKSVARPIIASALTTVAGLFALLFMSFGMGFDLGVVLIKGVFISLVASLLLFPALILLAEKLFDKTAKKALSFKGAGLCGFALKVRRVLIPAFLVLVVLCFFVKDGLSFGYTTNLGTDNAISRVFGANSTVLLVYENGDDNIAAEKAFTEEIGALKKSDGKPMLIGYTALSNTLEKNITAKDAAGMLGVSEADANILFAFNAVSMDKDLVKISTADLILFADGVIQSDNRVSDLVDEELKTQIQSGAELIKSQSGVAAMLSKPYTFEEQCDAIHSIANRFLGGMKDKPSSQLMAGVYAMYFAANSPQDIPAATATELLELVDTQSGDGVLTAFIDEDKAAQIESAKALAAEARKTFVGNKHSMMLLSLDLPAQGDDTSAFMKAANKAVEGSFGKGYLAGVIPSTYDLMTSFTYDNTLISIITIISLFLIVSLIFKSISLPVVLVSIIQGAVWFAMSVMCLWGRTEFFMSYIMSNCILMGATIDYGILMSSNYLTSRKTMDKAEALSAAVKSALPTVFTSGMTMIIAGFVICFISSQNAIADTGLIIGIGTIASCIFITAVLPAILYSADKLILKLTLRKKEKTLV